MRDKELFWVFFPGVEDRLWKTDVRCLWKHTKSKSVPRNDRAEDQCRPGTRLTEPFSKFNNFFRLDASCGMVEAVAKSILLKTGSPFLHVRTWRPFLLDFRCFPQSPSYLQLLAPELLVFNENIYGKSLSLTLGCYRSVSLAAWFPSGIDSGSRVLCINIQLTKIK